MRQDRREADVKRAGFEDPAALRVALTDTRFAWLWLVLRVAVGWTWLEAGWRHLQGSPRLAEPPGGWIAQAAAVGQTLVGIALILGVFVGAAAFAGVIIGSLAAGEAGTLTPLVVAASVWLVLTWKTAGWIGLDRWLLPLAGMPWRGGALLDGEESGIGHEAGGAVPRRG